MSTAPAGVTAQHLQRPRANFCRTAALEEEMNRGRVAIALVYAGIVLTLVMLAGLATLAAKLLM